MKNLSALAINHHPQIIDDGYALDEDVVGIGFYRGVGTVGIHEGMTYSSGGGAVGVGILITNEHIAIHKESAAFYFLPIMLSASRYTRVPSV